jgi:hypothetical protein
LVEIRELNCSFDTVLDVFNNNIETIKIKNNVETSFRITQKVLENSKWEVEELENREEKR